MTMLKMWKWSGLTGLVLLAAFAGFLAANRIYQVDEAQNLFMIRVLGTQQSSVYFTNGLLWMLGPLAWMAAGARESASLFFLGRMVFLGVFALNVWLTAVNAGAPLRSARGLLALMGAATLAPLWDYGFEVRHDNLILLGLLTMWWLGRTRPRGLVSYVGLGSLAVTLICVAFKAFAFVAPLSLVFLAFPPPGHHENRWRLLAAWVLGCAIAAVAIVLVYRFTGTGTLFLNGFGSGMRTSEGGARFGPSLALVRLLWQTPLLLGLWGASMVLLVQRMRVQGATALSWDGWVPEFLLSIGALGLILVNPTPFPYNLINLVPFVFLVSFRLFIEVTEGPLLPAGRVLLGGVLCFTHLVPFGRTTLRHLDWPNDRQETLMWTAEHLTDPARDRVYDGIGMVPTRPSIGFHWYLHSLNIRSFGEAGVPKVSTMLAEQPASVLIRSYRTDWLPEADQRFIRERYVPLSDDFWVLGQVLPFGGGAYSVVHPGRYQVLGFNQGKPVPPETLVVNGRSLDGHAVFLQPGQQIVTTEKGTQPVVVWVGPVLDTPPNLGTADHLRLFVNWY